MKSYKNKYLKYKQKYLNLKINSKGGFLKVKDDYNLIESVGFEFESGDMSLFYGDISDNLLNLTPFGYNENSTDSSQNRSLLKINLGKIETEYGNGEIIMSQDSYELFNSRENDKKMDMQEAITNKLNKTEHIFNLEDKQSNIHNIKFNIDIEKNLTIGDSELMITFLSLNNKNKHLIPNITDKIFNSIENIFKDDNLTYLGNFTIDYVTKERYKREIYESNESLKFNLLKLNKYTAYDKDIYILMNGNIKKNYIQNINWSPQITIGCKLENFDKILIELVTNIRKYNFYDTVKTHFEFINKLKFDEIEITDDELSIVNNYLLLLCTYMYLTDYDGYIYDIKSGNIDIHKFYTPILPRQFFYEILKKYDIQKYLNMLNENDNMYEIIFYTINNMRNSLDLPSLTYVDMDNYISNYNYSKYMTIDKIDDHFVNKMFSDLAKKDEKFFSENSYKIKKIIIYQIKSLTQFNEKDLFNTFTTKIPFSENIIFEYRELNSSVEIKLKEMYEDIFYFKTLDNFRFLNNANRLKHYELYKFDNIDTIINDNIIDNVKLFNEKTKESLNKIRELKEVKKIEEIERS